MIMLETEWKCFEWYRLFKIIQVSWTDDCHSDYQSMWLTDKISADNTLWSYQQLTAQGTAEDIGISYWSCFTILTENLSMQHVCKIQSLTFDGWIKENNWNICTELSTCWCGWGHHEINYYRWWVMSLRVCVAIKQRFSQWKSKFS